MSADHPTCPFIFDDLMVKTGNPVGLILDEAEKKGGVDDLVAMGAHGHKRLADAVMGNTSRRVLRRCKTPVLAVRLPEE
jgi:nucleotide-binding universal stress UspA family protein